MKPIWISRIASMRLPLLLVAIGLGGCGHALEETATAPNDFRYRHPIVVREADRGIDIFVGTGRGGLSAAQRADVAGLAQDWMREATGSIVINVPVETPN